MLCDYKYTYLIHVYNKKDNPSVPLALTPSVCLVSAHGLLSENWNSCGEVAWKSSEVLQSSIGSLD